MDLRPEKNAIFWVTLALLGSSIEPLIVKYGLGQGYLSSQLIVLKLVVGGFCFLPFLYKKPIPNRKELKKLVLISILAVITNYSIFLAVECLPVSLVITLISTTPIFIAIAHTIQGRVVLKKKFWPGLALVIIGITLCVAFKIDQPNIRLIGFVFITLSILGSVLYRSKVDELCHEMKPFRISTYIFIINGIFALVALPFITPITLSIIPLVSWLGLAGATANVGFIYAISILGATRTSVITLLQRPLVIVMGALIYNESLTFIQLLGIALVAIGIWLAKTEKKLLDVSLTSQGDTL